MKNKIEINLEPLGDLRVTDIYIADGEMTVRGKLSAEIEIEAEYAIDIHKNSEYFTIK